MAQLKHRHGDRRANASSPLPVKSKPVSPPPEKAPIHSGSPFSPGHSPTGWSPLRQNSPGRRGASTSRHQFSLSVSALRRRRRRGEEGLSPRWSEGGSSLSPPSPVFLQVFPASFSGGKLLSLSTTKRGRPPMGLSAPLTGWSVIVYLSPGRRRNFHAIRYPKRMRGRNSCHSPGVTTSAPHVPGSERVM